MTGKARWQNIHKMVKISLKKSLRKLFSFFFFADREARDL